MSADVERAPLTLERLDEKFISSEKSRLQTQQKGHADVNLESIKTLPVPAQLLISQRLLQNNPRFMLLATDPDASELLARRWISARSNSTVGVINYVFEPKIWSALKWISPQFLDAQMLTDLRAYVRRKSALYPWIW